MIKVAVGSEMRIWYNEDLGDRSEHDNNGTTCADVYALLYGAYNTPIFIFFISLLLLTKSNERTNSKQCVLSQTKCSCTQNHVTV